MCHLLAVDTQDSPCLPLLLFHQGVVSAAGETENGQKPWALGRRSLVRPSAEGRTGVGRRETHAKEM